jgi:hypothetical protein
MATPPDFTTGAVLTAAQMNGVGLWLVKTQTVGTGVTSVTVTDAFNADFENYKVIWTGGTTSGGTDMAFHFGATPPANGYYQVQFANSIGGAFGTQSVNNQDRWIYAGGGDANGAMTNMEIFQPFASKRKFMTAQNFTAGSFTVYSTGYFNSTASFTSFTLDPGGATTMTGGVVRVYGYRN